MIHQINQGTEFHGMECSLTFQEKNISNAYIIIVLLSLLSCVFIILYYIIIYDIISYHIILYHIILYYIYCLILSYIILYYVTFY